jgi:hypothetical protein
MPPIAPTSAAIASTREAEQVVRNEPLDFETETWKDEECIASIGRTNQGRFLVVITTEREARVRVVTAFPAPRDLIDFCLLHKGIKDGRQAQAPQVRQ